MVTDLEILRSKSAIFILNNDALESVISQLEKELRASKIKGVGLSAIQIGMPLRICIIRTEKLSLNLYNAKIIHGEGYYLFKGEGCLSVPDTYVDTLRMDFVTIKNGDGKEHELHGFEAVVAQHELDHWNGILMLDRRP